jgi:hypothetical protein
MTGSVLTADCALGARRPGGIARIAALLASQARLLDMKVVCGGDAAARPDTAVRRDSAIWDDRGLWADSALESG